MAKRKTCLHRDTEVCDCECRADLARAQARVAALEGALRSVGCQEENGEDIGPCAAHPEAKPCVVCALLDKAVRDAE